MKTLSRRSALALAAAATTLPGPRAQAQAYSPTEGREAGPGLRVYEISLAKTNQRFPASRW